MNAASEPQAIPPLNSGDIAHTLCDYGTTKLLYSYPSDGNVPLNNFPVGMHFRSKTDAIEKLCLKVFNATPIYGTDIEGLKTEKGLQNEINKHKTALREAWLLMDDIEGNDAVDEWQNKYSKYIESDHHSCADCDALASHGVNDGPCERHKL